MKLPPLTSPSAQRRLQYTGGALIYVLLFAYLMSFARHGFNIFDEGGFANGTLRTLEGETALLDFNPIGYLPGRYWFGAVFFHLFGIDIQSLRIGVAFITPAMILMVFAVARRIMSTGFAVLAAMLTLSAPAMYYNRFYPIFCVANLFFLVRALERASLVRILAFAVSVAVTFFFKAEVAVFSALIGLLLLAMHRAQGATAPRGEQSALSMPRRWALAAGALTVILFAAGIFIRFDVAQKLFHIVILSHGNWGAPFPPLFPFFEQYNRWGPHEMFERAMFYIPLAVYAVTALLLTLRLQRGGGISGHDLLLQSVLFFGAAAYGLVIWRAGFDNLLRTLPPFYILACYLLQLLHSRLSRDTFVADEREPAIPLPRSTVRRYTVNIALLALPVLFMYEMNYHHGFYAGSIGAVLQDTAPLRMEGIDVYTNPHEARWIKHVVRRIEELTEPGDPLFVLPLNPIFYFLSGRHNPTRYDWILPGMLDEAGQKQVVDELRARPPKLIVYMDIAIDRREERRFHRYAPIIHKYLVENYAFMEMIGVFQILAPKALA